MGCHTVTACFACATATAAAILLWGVGAEAVHYREYLQGGLLLADALVVTLLESLTSWQYLEWRRTRWQQSKAAAAAGPRRALHRAVGALDTYRRAAAYTALSVPCFVHVRRAWLPLLPGAMLLLSAALYTLKYCSQLRKLRSLAKVPSFVRFKDESVSAEIQSASPTAAAAAPAASVPMGPSLSHHSSFASRSSAQMGSKDSGIEASQRDAAASPATAAVAATGESKGTPRKPRGLVRANSSSPDRCCLINEDSLSLRD